MSEKNSSSVGASLLRDFALRGNRGVQLSRSGNHSLLARPLTADGRPDPASQVVMMPAVPAHLLECGAGLLRHTWRVQKTSAIWWLYVHSGQHRWWACFPPQACGERKIDVDASFKNCETPDPDLLLAGSLRSVPPGEADQLSIVEPQLPPHQGVHFVLDLGRQLTSLTAYIRFEQEVKSGRVSDLIDDPLDPSLTYLIDRLKFPTKT